MVAIEFDDRLFQRGQTWRECLEGWENRRDQFLRLAHDQEAMRRTNESLRCLPEGSRLAVYYSMWTYDALKSLPAIGKTFDSAPHVEVRYFPGELFFPLFYPCLGRIPLKLMLLDGEGRCRRIWGPRPSSVTNALAKRQRGGDEQMDRYMLNLSDRQLNRMLDRSISKHLFPAG